MHCMPPVHPTREPSTQTSGSMFGTQLQMQVHMFSETRRLTRGIGLGLHRVHDSLLEGGKLGAARSMKHSQLHFYLQHSHLLTLSTAGTYATSRPGDAQRPPQLAGRVTVVRCTRPVDRS